MAIFAPAESLPSPATLPIPLSFCLPVVLDSSLHTYGRSHRSSKRSPETFCNDHQHGLVTLLFVCGSEDPQWLVQKPRAEPPFASGHLGRHKRFGSYSLLFGWCYDLNEFGIWQCCIIDVRSMVVFIILIKKANLLYTLVDSRTSAVQPQQLIPAQVQAVDYWMLLIEAMTSWWSWWWEYFINDDRTCMAHHGLPFAECALVQPSYLRPLK